MRMKTYVHKHTSGLSSKCQIPGPRTAQFLACGMALAGQSLRCIQHLRAKDSDLTREEVKMLQKTLCEGIDLLKRGFRHEITIANVVEEEGWNQVKHYESHERIGRDERKRLDHVRQFRRAEDKKKQQHHNNQKKSSSSSGSHSNRRRNNFKGNRGSHNNSNSNNNNDKVTGKEKLTCFTCHLPGHISSECPMKQK